MNEELGLEPPQNLEPPSEPRAPLSPPKGGRRGGCSCYGSQRHSPLGELEGL